VRQSRASVGIPQIGMCVYLEDADRAMDLRDCLHYRYGYAVFAAESQKELVGRENFPGRKLDALHLLGRIVSRFDCITRDYSGLGKVAAELFVK